ncbi:hypothetical protein OOK41_00055 [Micromonospora sp. NBC_01655]|nr:hypothetical protein [Micromonospora sp. NBC_01655]MCX4468723.1 hypothetical protein [Micromonospora sp. NBC_01655]
MQPAGHDLEAVALDLEFASSVVSDDASIVISVRAVAGLTQE